jgi:hypothetical protein
MNKTHATHSVRLNIIVASNVIIQGMQQAGQNKQGSMAAGAIFRTSMPSLAARRQWPPRQTLKSEPDRAFLMLQLGPNARDRHVDWVPKHERGLESI